ncbi:MAG TPA: DNA mismatch repair endonuclease MutL, partial [Thermoanaerobaculia bacterium]|nr:DNA mismatch repair endonuclease MutL [Thermoanaerobaculia bacterium]
MPRIQILPDELVNQIAAGEVVERPASVVKELLENAIDAGASSVDILLENGGKKRIEIRDDGSGMSGDDATLALERHATSKIRAFDDLAHVRSLGFRGEALPSIASVSRFVLTTWNGSEDHATEIAIDPTAGTRLVRPAARDRGTTIAVEELFENVPARRKFLRSADAEFRSIVTIVSSYALPNPSLALRLSHNGRVVLDLPSAGSHRERIAQILGRDCEPHLEPVEGEFGGVRISGFVTRGLRYGSRRNQFFFVNGRLVRDRVLTHAAARAVERFDFDGHPAMVLFVELSPEAVDVNVHPAKTEVRFRDSSQVHVVVEQGVKRALGGAEEGAALLPEPVALQTTSAHVRDHLFATQRYDGTTQRVSDVSPLFQQQAVVQPPVEWSPPPVSSGAEAPAHNLGDLRGRVIGQYRLSYILLDVPGGLRLIDQHVAHERVLFDRYWARAAEHAPVSQHLLAPLLYECGARETALLDSHLSELRAVGFDIERFSGNTF